MPIEELQEPYWEKQEGETPNQYCYFLEFLDYPTNNLKDFHDHLCDKHKKTQPNTKIVTYDTLRKWAGEKWNKWHIRKAAKRKAEDDDIQDTLHELEKETKVEEYQTKQRINTKLLKRIEREVDENALSQIAQGIQGYKTLKDDNRVDRGEATDFTKSDVNADIDAKAQVETKADIAQDIILKPEYVELTRKLLEDVVNDS
jgi:hypothetical protein